jgi:hypothetical protein
MGDWKLILEFAVWAKFSYLVQIIIVQTPPPNAGASFQILLLLGFVIPAILFLLTQRNTLKTIRTGNRSMNPGLVWLQLIPLFGQLWQFFVVIRIADSIKKEVGSRQDDTILGFSDASAVEQLDKRPTLAMGIAYCILTTLTIIINLTSIAAHPWLYIVSALCSLSGVTCWIIYWVQLAGYKKELRIGLA